MDIDVSGWILEFLLGQNSLDDHLLNALIRVLPLPRNNSNLHKSLILRKISSDVEKGTIYERTLEFLEQIEELDHGEGNYEVSEAMRVAYSAVAVYCTVKCIEESGGDQKERYDSAVKRVWKGKFDAAKRVGLVSNDLLSLMDGIGNDAWDLSVCENVLGKYKELDVLEVVRGYVNEAKEKMGPSFLELAAEATLSDDVMRELMGLGKDRGYDNQFRDGAPNVDANANCNSKSDNNETCRSNVLHRRKHIVARGSRSTGRGTHRGVKIVDTMETSPNKYDSIHTPEVNKVQQALDTGTSEPNAAVKDPQSDASHVAQCLKDSLTGKHTAADQVVGNLNSADMGAPSSSHDNNSEALEANRDDIHDGFPRDQNKRPKPSLLERNNTAHAIEWCDSIDTSSERGSPTRAHLPSPKKRDVSPLKTDEIRKLTRMRKKKRWTSLEEDTLRTGVQKYGKGNWKLILNMYHDIFLERTEVDLKDKWRNLTR